MKQRVVDISKPLHIEARTALGRVFTLLAPRSRQRQPVLTLECGHKITCSIDDAKYFGRWAVDGFDCPECDKARQL